MWEQDETLFQSVCVNQTIAEMSSTGELTVVEVPYSQKFTTVEIRLTIVSNLKVKKKVNKENAFEIGTTKMNCLATALQGCNSLQRERGHHAHTPNK